MKKFTTTALILSMVIVNSNTITANATEYQDISKSTYEELTGNTNMTLTEKEFEINTLEGFLVEAKQIVQEKNTGNKFNYIYNYNQPSTNQDIGDKELNLLEKTNPEIINQYNALLAREISEFSIDYAKVPSGDSEVEYTLPKTGAQITVTTTSELIKADLSPGVQTAALINRPFGTYNYTIKHKITAALYPDSICALVTTYTTKSDGLRLTAASKAGTLGIFPTGIVSSAKITDSRAEKIGYDINAQGDYTVTIGGYNGIGLVSFDVTITSTVRWDASTSNSLHVTEKYSQIGDLTKKN
ncbi:hypothetical protein P9B03_20130 [Metasolibacillus meyeri]|uniref:Uncharacterized protein n=1 Tax=Metasolibacillus meyeri TaxID=1071052 RepID=A0AAW9NTE6_9BACL|nr:hypothetical protein [Metasolibacillus meyeri]MEC1180765.1 hypothetical protein [Metasolibacillus meyeri]